MPSAHRQTPPNVILVGFMGSGKSTVARVLMGLETATGGEVRFQDASIGDVLAGERTPQQLGALQMIFQNPNDTLNPGSAKAREKMVHMAYHGT